MGGKENLPLTSFPRAQRATNKSKTEMILIGKGILKSREDKQSAAKEEGKCTETDLKVPRVCTHG